MKRVLICDDSPVDRKVIAKSLEKHFEVLQADGGDAALEIVRALQLTCSYSTSTCQVRTARNLA